jgi:hypothetical protein
VTRALTRPPARGLVVSVIAAVVVISVAACGGNEDEAEPRIQPAPAAAAVDYPKAPAEHLAEPFTGAPVPESWLGLWRTDQEIKGGGFLDVHILGATSPECRSITRGRTTCWTVGDPGASTEASDVYAAGSITVKDGLVIWRMTYNPNPDSLQCFEDDAYEYRYTPDRLQFPMDDRKHCHRELPDDPFTGFRRIG